MQVSPGLAVGKYVDSDEVRVVVVGTGVRDEVAVIGSRVGSSVLMGTAVGESVGFSVYSRSLCPQQSPDWVAYSEQ